MKKLLTALLLLGAFASSNAQDSIKAVKAELNYSGKYIYKGMEFSKGSVLQPSLELKLGTFSAYGFANYDFALKNISEKDLILDYSIKLSDKFNALLDYTHLNFNSDFFMKSNEAYAGVTSKIDSIEISGLVGRLWYNYSDKKESYTELSLYMTNSHFIPFKLSVQKPLSSSSFYIEGSTSITIFEQLKADVSTSYSNKYWTEYSGFTHTQFSLESRFNVLEFELIPEISYIHAIDRDNIRSGVVGSLRIAKDF